MLPAIEEGFNILGDGNMQLDTKETIKNIIGVYDPKLLLESRGKKGNEK